MPLKQQQQKHQQRDKEDDKYPIIYRVTSSGLALQTRQNYERDINQFLNHFNIKDIEPLKEYSLQVCKQMIIDYVIHLRENKKLSRASIKFHLYAIRLLFFMIREDEFPRWDKINIELPPHEYSHRDRGYTIGNYKRCWS
jgi:site-specific recombinase XerD